MRETLEKIFRAALAAADPEELVRGQTAPLRRFYEKGGFSKLLVAGFGKASCRMAAALEAEMLGLITDGIAITKYGHGCPLKKIQLREAGHPLPDENGEKATLELLRMLECADEKTLIVGLISGGGSALLVKPAEGITLAEKQHTTDLLLKAGADIYELNTVRKHISLVKGGRLAQAARPAAMRNLIISDVLGDRPDMIASGPSAADPTTFAEAFGVLVKYDLLEKTPRSVLEALSKGMRGEIRETPKEGDPMFERVENTIIGSNRLALEGAKREAESLGLDARIITAELAGEAREAAKSLAKTALLAKREGGGKLSLLSGGETTVTVRGDGKGGRNMELALAFALEVEGVPGIRMLSAGTDGTDGPTDAAGAVVDGETIRRARRMSLDPLRYFMNNDSYTFFERAGGLLRTGPTGTNVMDVQIITVEDE